MDKFAVDVDDPKRWYAMRVTYRRELQVKQQLDALHVDNFIPMKREAKVVRGRKVQVMVPVIHNLLFVHASKSKIQAIKAKNSCLQYMTIRSEGKNIPIVVPDRQMEDFMTVSSSDDCNLIYYDTSDVGVAAGTPVRIHGGSFDGLTGTFVKVKGKRSKKVVIAIQNVLAVVIDTFNYDFIEIIK